MSLRNELILQALRRRLSEVCEESILALHADKFGDQSSFVAQISDHFSKPAAAQITPTTKHLNNETWSTSHTDFFTAVMKLASEQPLELEPDPNAAQSFESFLQDIHAQRDDPERVVTLTIDRYACPLNFRLRAEAEVQEYFLQRLMVHLRARAERGRLTKSETQDVLVKLNLVAINAARTKDLRFLDALNYYYELLITNLQRNFQHNWLWVSYLALYAQALAACCRED